MKGLPIGIQTLSKIVKNNFVYIDKTPFVYQLYKNPLYYFLSRPRRFGKSLLLDTLNEVFSGNQKLFKGLWIEDKIQWEKYPIIRLSFDKMNTNSGFFEQSLSDTLLTVAKDEDIEISQTHFKGVIEVLAKALSKREGKGVVILIDEYDRPILDHLHTSVAETNRDILRAFFSSLKGLDEYIHFVFITGISKFSQVSLFSSANNLTDITLDPEFSSICGYTQQNLELYFEDRIKSLSEKNETSIDATLSEIKYWYNGYSWNGEAVYNPFSVLKLFKLQQFGNYWFETGSPNFLIKVLFDTFQYRFEHSEASYNLLATGFDVNRIDPSVLMFQGGYLTIKSYDRNTRLYTLDYPNQEVKESLQEFLLYAYAHSSSSDIHNIAQKIKKSLFDNDIERFISLSNTLFSYIPEPIFIEQYEAYYQSLLYLVFSLIGVQSEVEEQTNKGRIDTVVTTPHRIFVLEYKIGQKAEEALKQIKDRKYYEKFLHQHQDVVLMGLSLGTKDRGIIEYKLETIKN